MDAMDKNDTRREFHTQGVSCLVLCLPCLVVLYCFVLSCVVLVLGCVELSWLVKMIPLIMNAKERPLTEVIGLFCLV